MPTFILGLPVHVLVVHAVVVLVPLAVLGALVMVFRPDTRRYYGWLAVGVAALGTACIPIATSSGERLERSLPRTALMEAHTRLGDELLPFAGLLLVAMAGMMLLDRYQTPTATPTWLRPATVTLSVITVLLAVVTSVQVVRIGDSGARAAWGDKPYIQQAPPSHPGDAD